MISRAEPGAPNGLTFAVTEPLGPVSLGRRTDATERVLFGLMYEPLVRLDCRGAPNTALAVSWSPPTRANEHQTLTLRDNARFWNGDQVDVRALAEQLGRASSGSRLHAEPLDARRLTVTSTSRNRDPILELSDPAYAHVGPARVGPWPLGTGPYSPAPASNGQVTTLVPTADARAQVIRLHLHTGPDERDALDAGADLMVSSSTQTITYARAHPDFDVAPLPWENTYAYISASARSTAPPPLATTLFRDAVPTDARPTTTTHWWQPERECREPQPAPAPVPTSRTTRIAYDARDPVARAIAERLVALADTRSPSDGTQPITEDFGTLATLTQPPRATPMSRDDLLASLETGHELGWVLALPLPAHGGCPGYHGPLTYAPWVTPEMIVPLIDTRAHLIFRRGAANIVLGGDGRIQILPRDARP